MKQKHADSHELITQCASVRVFVFGEMNTEKKKCEKNRVNKIRQNQMKQAEKKAKKSNAHE